MRLVFRAVLEDSISLIYTIDSEAFRRLIPAVFEPVTEEGLGFWSVSISRLRSIRPAGLPQWCGVDLTAITHGILVRTVTGSGRELIGSHIVRTDADALARVLARELTDFQFRKSRIEWKERENGVIISADSSPDDIGNAYLHFVPRAFSVKASVPLKSEFRTLYFDPIQQHVRITEASLNEGTMIANPISVREAHWNIFRELQLHPTLVSATHIQASEYFLRVGDYMEPAPVMSFV